MLQLPVRDVITRKKKHILNNCCSIHTAQQYHLMFVRFISISGQAQTKFVNVLVKLNLRFLGELSLFSNLINPGAVI